MQKIAAVFPGSDSQFVGMYKALYDEHQIVRETIEEAEEVTGINLGELCFKGPLSVLSRSENSHAAVVAFSVAAFRVFVSETGLTPQFCAGHSLGEYSALACAGAMKFSDTLKLVKIRNEISKEVQKATKGGMTIVDGIDSTIVDSICRKQQKDGRKVYVSCYNSPTQTAISGVQADVVETEKLIRQENGTVSPLYNSAPYHCPVMGAGIDKLREVISQLEPGDFRYPVISNHTGKPYRRIQDLEENLLNHLTSPVRWEDIVSFLESKNVQLVIDFSARNIFENIIGSRKLLRTVCYGVREEREALFELLQGEDYRKSKTSFISKSIIAAISTPNLNLEQAGYNAGVVLNYQRLTEISQGLDNGSIIYSQDVKRNILSLLKLIFEEKKINKEEQGRWIQGILDETASTYQNLI